MSWIIIAKDSNGEEIFRLSSREASEKLGKTVSRVINASRSETWINIDGEKIYLSRMRSSSSSRRKKTDEFNSIYRRIMSTDHLNTIMMTDPSEIINEFKERGMTLRSRHVKDGDFWILELER